MDNLQAAQSVASSSRAINNILMLFVLFVPALHTLKMIKILSLFCQ